MWELNSCIVAYNQRKKAEGKEDFLSTWTAAALTGAAFAGKLKKAGYYLPDDEQGPKAQGRPVTLEQMEDFERRRKAKKGGGHNGV